MRKRMQVKYKDRKLLVSFDSLPDNNEFLSFKVVLQDILESDAYFVAKMDTHFPVVEHYDEEFKEQVELNVTCEMPPSGSKLNLKFIPYNVKSHNQTQEAADDNFQQMPEPEIMINEAEDSKASGSSDPSADNDISNHRLTKKRGVKFPRFDINTLVLPTFSARLQNIIKDGKLTLQTTLFVQEVADYLLTLVSYPTPSEYSIYCNALIQKYPELKVPNHYSGRDYGALKLSISNRIRNQRYKYAKLDKVPKGPKKHRVKANQYGKWAVDQTQGRYKFERKAKETPNQQQSDESEADIVTDGSADAEVKKEYIEFLDNSHNNFRDKFT